MLVQALLGLHVNENGSDDHVLEVLVDNINVQSVDEEPLRASVSLVPKVRTHHSHHAFLLLHHAFLSLYYPSYDGAMPLIIHAIELGMNDVDSGYVYFNITR